MNVGPVRNYESFPRKIRRILRVKRAFLLGSARQPFGTPYYYRANINRLVEGWWEVGGGLVGGWWRAGVRLVDNWWEGGGGLGVAPVRG